jgi:hypothetical protein
MVKFLTASCSSQVFFSVIESTGYVWFSVETDPHLAAAADELPLEKIARAAIHLVPVVVG